MGAEALVIGTGIQAFSSYSAARSKADMMVEQAKQRSFQAAMSRESAKREMELTDIKGKKILGAQTSAIGRSGTQLSGSNLLVLEETASNIRDELAAIQQSSDYKQYVFARESELDITLAGETRRAGLLSAFGSIASGVGSNPYLYNNRIKGDI